MFAADHELAVIKGEGWLSRRAVAACLSARRVRGGLLRLIVPRFGALPFPPQLGGVGMLLAAFVRTVAEAIAYPCRSGNRGGAEVAGEPFRIAFGGSR